MSGFTLELYSQSSWRAGGRKSKLAIGDKGRERESISGKETTSHKKKKPGSGPETSQATKDKPERGTLPQRHGWPSRLSWRRISRRKLLAFVASYKVESFFCLNVARGCVVRTRISVSCVLLHCLPELPSAQCITQAFTPTKHQPSCQVVFISSPFCKALKLGVLVCLRVWLHIG